MPEDNNRLCIAVITGAHGVHGNLRLKTFSQDPLAILKYKTVCTESGDVHKIKNARVHKGETIIIKFEEITDRNLAEAMQGTKLYIQRSELPDLEEEEFYHADLIGLKVRSLEGEFLGTVAALYNFGAGDLLEIMLDKTSKLFIVPFTKACVPEVNVKEKFVLVDPSQVLTPDEVMQLETAA